jgi:hypothetical protein
VPTSTTTLQVTFVSESASYSNTFGWYDSVTGMGGILFADVDALAPGATATFTVNTADLANIQYFLIPDGADHNTTAELTGAVKVIQLSDGTWAVADVDSNGNVIFIHKKPDTLDGVGADALFTETSKNAGGVDYASSVAGSSQTAATLAGDTADGPTGLIAWEDQAAKKIGQTYGAPGDADYNDAVFNVTVLNTPPETNAASATGNEDTTITIALSGSDIDGTVTSFRITSLPANGTLYSDAALTQVIAVNGTVAASGNAATVYFAPSANFNGGAAFQYASIDNGGAQDATPATATITVNPVNDAPAGANHTVTATEDGSYVFATSDFGFTDPNDTPTNTLQAVEITTLPGAGTLFDNGVAVTAGQFVSAADIAGGLLTFVPAANGNGTGYASFTFQVQDNGGIANGGVDLDQSPNTMTVNVTAVNDAPSGADNTVTAPEDGSYTFAAADFGFSDPVDAASASGANSLQAVKITTLPGAGTLFDNGVPVLPGQFVSAADIAAGLLKFVPAANANGAGYASFTFQVQDNGGTAGGGVDLDQSPNTITINVNAVNDAPAGTDNTVTTNEDAPYVFATADFGFTDPNDTPANTLQAVKITTLPGAGTLFDNGVAVTAGQFVSAADIAAGLLTFVPAANANGAGYASFTFQVQDNGGTAGGGVDLDQSPNTISVTVNAVNDAPAGTNNTVTANEDASYAFATSDFGFTDPNDSPANTLQAVEITTLPAAGTLFDNGVPVTAGQFVSAADIAAGLLTFVPAANGNGNGYASFTFQVQDNGGTANGGVDLDQSPNTMTINVAAVNDAPAGADKTVTTNEDAPYVFATSDFGFSDPVDATSASGANSLQAVKITTLPAVGTLFDNGVAVTPGQFVSAADIAAGLLTFVPAANANGAGYASFTFQVQDNGGTAAGGVDLDQSPNTISINVNAVNDAPTFTEATTTVVRNEDAGPQTIANFLTAISPGGGPDEAGQTVSIVVTGNSNTALFSVQPTISNTGTLSFTAAANYSGTATITFHAHDNGGIANGGVDNSADQTVTIDIAPVADAPSFSIGSLTPTAFTGESQANTHTAGIQNDAVVGALAGGGYVVAWNDTEFDFGTFSDEQIRARIYDANGTPVSGSDIELVNDGLLSIRHVTVNGLPVSASEAPGGFVVTYQGTSLIDGSVQIYGSIFDATGATVTSEFQISTDPTTQEQTLSSVAVSSDGSFVVTWEDIPAVGPAQIWAQRFNSAGVAVAQNGTTPGLVNFLVSDLVTTDNQDTPDIAALTNGSFVATWTSESQDGAANAGVLARVFSAAGIPGLTFEVNSTTSPAAQGDASVTALKGGGFAVSWTSVNQVSGSSGADVYVRLFNASGTATTGEILVDTTTTGAQEASNVIGLSDGGFLVMWDSNQDSGSEGVFAQRFDGAGAKVGGEFRMNATIAGSQTVTSNQDHDPAAVLNSGKVVGVWDGSPGDAGDIFGRIFNIPGDGPQNGTNIVIDTISALVTDTVGTTTTNGGHEIIDHITLSNVPAGFTFSVGHAGAPGIWIIDQQADITALQTTALTMTPAAGFSGFFTLDVTASVTDTAHLSTGDVTNSLTTSALHIPIGVRAPGDPIFAADSAGSFALHLDPVAAGDTVTITSLPGNGAMTLGDGTPVGAHATLSAEQFASLTFTPSDLGADTSANFQFTVSNGTTETVNTVPLNLVHGTGVTLTGSVADDHLIGSAGSDVLNGGPGHDILTGGAGADRFVFDQAALADATGSMPKLDHVTDYSAAQGDVLDFSALQSTASGEPSIFVHADASGGFATVQIDLGTAGSHHLVNIAVLDGVHAGDVVTVGLDPTHTLSLHAGWLG